MSVDGDDPQLQVVCDGSNFNPDIGWHPQTGRIAVPKRRLNSKQKGQIYVINPNDKDPYLDILPGQPDDRNNGGLSWSRDGKLFVFVSRPEPMPDK